MNSDNYYIIKRVYLCIVKEMSPSMCDEYLIVRGGKDLVHTENKAMGNHISVVTGKDGTNVSIKTYKTFYVF